jgi:TRAP-type C4-dicarboxylate transport system substrate-binding protein
VVKKKWDQLSPQLRKQIKDICQKNFQELNDKVRKQNQEALAILADKQIITIKPTEQGMKDFQKAVDEVANKLIGVSYSQDSLTMTQAILSEYRSVHQ